MTCRLCGAPSNRVFEHTVLGRYQVAYFASDGCGNLQTEPAYWLDEAYAIEGVHIDAGQAARVMQTWLRVFLMLERIGFGRSLFCSDYGSSAVLLARLMCDSGSDYRVYDRYDTGKYGPRLPHPQHAGIATGPRFRVLVGPGPAGPALCRRGAGRRGRADRRRHRRAMVTALGWGTVTTERDHAYAMKRLESELANNQAAPPPGLLARIRAAIQPVARSPSPGA